MANYMVGEQDAVYLVDVEKVEYKNGELVRCYFNSTKFYLLRTYREKDVTYGILIKDLSPKNTYIKHEKISNIYSTREECEKVVCQLNESEASKGENNA